MSMNTIELWHKRARPRPTYKDFNVQLGCHAEEFAEMLESLVVDGYNLAPLVDQITAFANALKGGTAEVAGMAPQDFLDSLCDQIVTAIGAGYTAGMNMSEAINRVDSSNWSKFDDEGQPLRDANGKIAKGPKYAPPDLEGLY